MAWPHNIPVFVLLDDTRPVRRYVGQPYSRAAAPTDEDRNSVVDCKVLSMLAMGDFIERFVFSALEGVINRNGWSLPRIRKVGYLITARSPVTLGISTLGGSARVMTLDINRKFVRLRDRRFWFFRWSQVFTFDQIAGIEYGYVNLNRANDYIPMNSYQEVDIFEIGLRLVDNKSVQLFQFRGEGAWDNSGPLPDWMYLGDQLDAQLSAGNQEQESRILAEVMSSRIGVPLVELSC